MRGRPPLGRPRIRAHPPVSARTRPPRRGAPRVAPPSSVYPEREDTELLVPFARAGPGVRLLDLGTGNGRLALEAARSGSRVTASDLNPHALRLVRERARMEGLRVVVVRTDLARGLGRFDRIVANPPYLPTRAAERDPDPWANLALDGGPDGCRVLRRIVRALPAHLAHGASAYVLVSSVQDPEALARIRRRWTVVGGRVRSVAHRVLEGERLEVWRLDLARPTRRAARRSGRRPRGTGGRRRTPRRPGASSRAPADGRTSARGAA
jgi:release factor glutamine methyltransferase